DDRALAAGFLFSERVIRTPDDIGAVEHCRHPDRAEAHHVVDVFLRGAAAASVREHLDGRRRVLATSACGVCGRAAIDALRCDIVPVGGDWTIAAATLSALAAALRGTQSIFAETGGLHAAGLFERDGSIRAAAEDVGRHNAVDKVIGRMLLDERLPLDDTVLMVSGRTSFEIVQKAWVAGIPVVAAVSAPSSLAVDLAHEAGITLIGFLRGDSFNIYAHPRRVRARWGESAPSPQPPASSY
ncbi:MAG TPA: formate dehydrogenase accessory sulfurtransferase FdhD, partial [Vicinamibacterales bacterium]|nr:formate dehydrogenase accessory sulfurtransferase FdhD [Vicinamibacterales bacterium]